MENRIFLSPPNLTGLERKLVEEAFDSNYVAPVGPMLNRFEEAFSSYVGLPFAVAVSSGTAALHLALLSLDIGSDHTVIAPSFTFIGGVAPISYVNAIPIFVDVDPETWCMDLNCLESAVQYAQNSAGKLKAVIPADILGQCAPIDEITKICTDKEIDVVLDSAESLGARYMDRPAGQGARAAAYSFNGNKIITTSGGGMLATDDKKIADRARYFSTAARQNCLHYEHTEVGYNYRLSNILAAIGLGQLQQIEQKVKKRRKIFKLYRDLLSDVRGLEWSVEGTHRRHSRWLTTLLVDSERFGATKNDIIDALETQNIESRPLWKPMHMQPVYKHAKMFGGQVSENLFEQGLCLPSGSDLEVSQIEKISDVIRSCYHP